MVEILRSGKRKRKLCDGDDHKYTLSEIQHFTTLQVVSELVEKTADSESDDDASVYCPEEEISGEYETIEKLVKLKTCNSGNVPLKQNSSVNDCNGKNASNPELPRSGKYFRKRVSVRHGQTLEHRINN